MKPAIVYVAAATVCWAIACSSNSDAPAGAYTAGGASSDGGTSGGSHHPTSHAGSAGKASGGGSSEGGAGGAAGEAGAMNDAGAAGLEQGVVVVVSPAACSEAADWTGAALLAGVSTTDTEQLLSITADELDIVFARNGALFRAHRSAATAAFDAGSAVTIPDGYDLTAGAALSADGKTLVLVATSGQAFASLTRNSRTGEFGNTADPGAFAGLNARALQTLEHYTHPVLSPDGKSLVFAAFTPSLAGGPAVVYESVFSNSGWAMPSSISHYIFDGTTEKRPLPSGISSDSRTLFYYDEALSQQVARFRDRPDAPLYTVVDLGGRTGSVPNGSCKRIYYTSNGNVLSEAD
jgi:WD40-like Beta Propeller Repeat